MPLVPFMLLVPILQDIPAPIIRSRQEPDRPTVSQDFASEDEIVVRARQGGNNRVDRRTYSIEARSTHPSSNARSVLKKIPGVTVAAEGEIQIRGNTNIAITVDGKVPPPGFLDTLLADQIDSVEIMTNPGASYDPGGTGGVINIILKERVKTVRLAGNALIELTTPASASAVINARREIGRFSVRGALQKAENRGPDRYYFAEQEIYANGFLIDRYVKSEVGRDSGSLTNVSGSLGYKIKEEQKLTLSIARNDSSADNKITALLTGPLPRNNFSEERVHKRRNGVTTGGASFDTPLGTGSLSAKFSANYRADSTTSSLTERIARDNSLVPGELSSRQAWRRRGFSTGAEVNSEPRKGRALTAGASFSRESSNITSSGTLHNETSHFRGTEERKDIYSTYQFPIGKFNLQPGIRLEWTSRRFSTHTIDSNVLAFPSFHLGSSVATGMELKGSYSRRIDRLAMNRYDPAILLQSATLATAGNPNLRPQIVDSFEISMEKINRDTRLLASVYFRYTHDLVSDFATPLSGDRVLVRPVNFGSLRTGGIEFASSGNLFRGRLARRVSFNVTSNLFYEEVPAADPGEDLPRSAITWAGTARLEYKLRSRGRLQDRLELELNSQGRRLTAQGYNLGYTGLTLSLFHDINARTAVNFSVSRALGRWSAGGVIDTPTIKSSWRRELDAPRFRLTLSHRLPD